MEFNVNNDNKLVNTKTKISGLSFDSEVIWLMFLLVC